MEATNWEEITINITALIEKRMTVSMEQKIVSVKAQDPKDTGHDLPGTIQHVTKAAADPDLAL